MRITLNRTLIALAAASILSAFATPSQAIMFCDEGKFASYSWQPYGSLTGVPTASLVDKEGRFIDKNAKGSTSPYLGMMNDGLAWTCGVKPAGEKCDRISTTLLCYWGNTKTSGSRCNEVKDAWVADHPLQPNQNMPKGADYIETCHIDGEAPEPVVAETTDTNVNVTIQKPTLPSYSRDGSALANSTDDFTGKHK